jgi:hypothetical protein
MTFLIKKVNLTDLCHFVKFIIVGNGGKKWN